MPASDPPEERRDGRLLTVLFWAGVGLAPLAALLLLLGQGEGPLRVAAVLAVLAVVLIGLSITLRPTGEAVRLDLEELLLEEIDMLRQDVRADITTAARATHKAFGEKLQVLYETVEALRGQVDGARAAGGRPGRQPPTTDPDRVGQRATPAHPEHVVDTAAPAGVSTRVPSAGRLSSHQTATPPHQTHQGVPAVGTHQGLPAVGYQGASNGHQVAQAGHQAADAGRQAAHVGHQAAHTGQQTAHTGQQAAHMGQQAGHIGHQAAQLGAQAAQLGQHVAAAPAGAPAGIGVPGPVGLPGGVVRHTETVHVTTRQTIVDQHGEDPRHAAAPGGLYGREAEPPSSGLPASADPRLRDGAEQRRPRPYERGDEGLTTDDGDWSDLRAGDRWASVRSDEHGRELRMGERRSAMHTDASGTEMRVEDRWATMRRDEARRDGSRRDGSRRDQPRRDEPRRQEHRPGEARREDPRWEMPRQEEPRREPPGPQPPRWEDPRREPSRREERWTEPRVTDPYRDRADRDEPRRPDGWRDEGRRGEHWSAPPATGWSAPPATGWGEAAAGWGDAAESRRDSGIPRSVSGPGTDRRPGPPALPAAGPESAATWLRDWSAAQPASGGRRRRAEPDEDEYGYRR